jgi:SAM-dependent methyltransferase
MRDANHLRKSLQLFLGTCVKSVVHSMTNKNNIPADLTATAQKWGSEEHSFQNTLSRGWCGSPIVLAYRARMATGSDTGNSSIIVMNHLSPQCKSGKVLVLGCGQSFTEHWLAASGTANLAHGIDVSPAAVEKARAEAVSQGLADRVSHEVMDINNLKLIENSFDGLLISQSMHHFERLEHICSEIVKGLKPGAPIVIDDFVGPTRFQYSDARLALMNRLLACLPPHLQKPPIERIPIEAFLRDDPSEGVRCGEIPGIIRRFFSIESELPYGGSIIYQLLQDIVPNINHNDPRDRAIVSLLVTFEEYLITTGVMESDFVTFFARNSKQ